MTQPPKKRPTHLVDTLIASLTACGMAGKWNAIDFSTKTKEVTCKLCLKTHWFKKQSLEHKGE